MEEEVRYLALGFAKTELVEKLDKVVRASVLREPSGFLVLKLFRDGQGPIDVLLPDSTSMAHILLAAASNGTSPIPAPLAQKLYASILTRISELTALQGANESLSKP